MKSTNLLLALSLVVAPLVSGCTSEGASPNDPVDGGGEASVGDGPVATDAPTKETSTPTEAGTDGGVADAATEASADAGGDALPPGTVVIGHIEEHMSASQSGGADSCTSADGHDFCAGSCSGTCAGSGDAGSVSTIQTGLSNPALDGSSTRVDVTGARTDTLEWIKLDRAAQGSGVYRDDTHFQWDFYFFPTTTTDVQAYEFDAFFASGGWWLMMGTQCDLASGNWNGWNQETGHWIPSSIDGCGSFFHMNEWNHIVISLHRDPGPVGASTRYYYDGLEVNGASHTWGLGGFTGTMHPTWDDVVGVQVQQDLTPSFSSTLSSYYAAMTFEISP